MGQAPRTYVSFYFGARRRKKKNEKEQLYLSPMSTSSDNAVSRRQEKKSEEKRHTFVTNSKRQRHSVAKDDEVEESNHICHQLQNRVKESGQQYMRFGNIALSSSSTVHRIIHSSLHGSAKEEEARGAHMEKIKRSTQHEGSASIWTGCRRKKKPQTPYGGSLWI